MTRPADVALLAAVEQSPSAAANHDRAGWVALFTADGTVGALLSVSHIYL